MALFYMTCTIKWIIHYPLMERGKFPFMPFFLNSITKYIVFLLWNVNISFLTMNDIVYAVKITSTLSIVSMEVQQ